MRVWCICTGAVSVALVYYYFDDNPRQMLDKGRATLIVTTLMVGTCSAGGTAAVSWSAGGHKLGTGTRLSHAHEENHSDTPKITAP